MATARVAAGACGFHTIVEAKANDGYMVSLQITSDCEAIQRLAKNLTEVNALDEISHAGQPPATLQKGAAYCTHAACPVPVGILKAVEVAAGLAVPADVTITLEG